MNSIISINFPASEKEAANGVMLSRTYAVMTLKGTPSRTVIFLSPTVAEALLNAFGNDGRLIKIQKTAVVLDLGEEKKKVNTYVIVFPTFLLQRITKTLQSMTIEARFTSNAVLAPIVEASEDTATYDIFEVSLADKLAQLTTSVLEYRARQEQLKRQAAEKAEQTLVPVEDAYETIRQALLMP